MKSFPVKIIILLSVIFISTGINAQSNLKELKKKIDNWNKIFSKATVENDYKTILSFYADDAISMPSYSPMMKGKTEIAKGMEMSEEAGTKMNSFELKSMKVSVSGNYLLDIGTYRFSMEMRGTPQPYNDHGKYMTVYEKQDDGSWKIIADMWNTDTNPWAAIQQMQQNKK